MLSPENEAGGVELKGGKRGTTRIETAVDVLSQLELETFLPYAADDVIHRFLGPEPLRGSGIGKRPLRATMLKALRHCLAGLDCAIQSKHFGSGHAVMEWSCRAQTLEGRSDGMEGAIVIEHEHGVIRAVRGYFNFTENPSMGASEDREGQEVDEKGHHHGDSQKD